MVAAKRTYTAAMQMESDQPKFRAFAGRLDEPLLRSLEGMGYE